MLGDPSVESHWEAASHPDMPSEACAVAIQVLVGVATLRHGDLAVLRALSRQERQDADILRAL